MDYFSLFYSEVVYKAWTTSALPQRCSPRPGLCLWCMDYFSILTLKISQFAYGLLRLFALPVTKTTKMERWEKIEPIKRILEKYEIVDNDLIKVVSNLLSQVSEENMRVQYPKRSLLAHFEATFDFSRSEFTCTL